MIDLDSFLTPLDILFELGGQSCSTQNMLRQALDCKDDCRRESIIYEILTRRKLLYDFISFMSDCKGNDTINFSDTDLQDIHYSNQIVTAFVTCGIENHRTEFLTYVTMIIKNKLFDYEALKKDVHFILEEPNYETSSFQQCLLHEAMKSQLHFVDILSAFSKYRSLFSKVCSNQAQMWIEEATSELVSIQIDDIIKILYEITKKRALSKFAESRDVSSALEIYTKCFLKILDYEMFDYEKYLDLASESLISLGEVIS